MNPHGFIYIHTLTSRSEDLNESEPPDTKRNEKCFGWTPPSWASRGWVHRLTQATWELPIGNHFSRRKGIFKVGLLGLIQCATHRSLSSSSKQQFHPLQGAVRSQHVIFKKRPVEDLGISELLNHFSAGEFFDLLAFRMLGPFELETDFTTATEMLKSLRKWTIKGYNHIPMEICHRSWEPIFWGRPSPPADSSLKSVKIHENPTFYGINRSVSWDRLKRNRTKISWRKIIVDRSKNFLRLVKSPWSNHLRRCLPDRCQGTDLLISSPLPRLFGQTT